MHASSTVYAAKCYWPGATEQEVGSAVARVVAATRNPAVYLGALLFPADELVLCLFEGASRTAIQRTVERAGIPSERIMASVWMPARRDVRQ